MTNPARRRPGIREALLMAAAAVALGACRGDPPSATDRLHPCAIDEGPGDAYCGHFGVFEDRATRKGRSIDLKIVVAPALRRDPGPDPLFVFDGGPGAGAATLASSRLPWFRRLQTDRDIVFVDLRGTGAEGLDCEPAEDAEVTLAQLVEPALDRLRACLDDLGRDADPRLYTTSLAMDDIDEVRQRLGYDQINVWGLSYGTRAALVYLARHEASVRSMVLDSVHAPYARTPLYWPRDGQRALDRLMADCAADRACNVRFPNLGATVDAVLARAAERPTVRVRHPRTGMPIEGPISRDFIAGIVFATLYSTLAASVLPQLLADAAQGDFQGLIGLALQGGPPAKGTASEALFLSVHCSEDAPRITRDQVVREATGTFLGSAAFDTVFKPCEFWPRGDVDAEFHRPVTSAVPVLLLSGAEDPKGAAVWAEQVAMTLKSARHVVVPGTGHVTSLRGCVPTLIREFLETIDAAALDVSCLGRLRRPPFFVDRSGPETP